MVTQDYNVSLPFGTTELASSVSSLNDGAGSASMKRSMETMDPWSELGAALTRAAPQPAEVSGSPLAGRVTIFGPPSVQRQAAKVIADFEEAFATRIGLEVGVYFVDFDHSDDFGVGLGLGRIVGGTNIGITGAAGALSGNGVVTLSRSESNAINFKALARDSTVVDHKIASRIMQSGTGNSINLSSTEYYVARATTTNNSGTTSTSIETSSVDDGLVIQALPRLVAGNKIQLHLHILENDLTQLQSFESAGTTVQLPKVSRRAIPHELLLSSGETTILSGYERERASRSNTGTGSPRFLGLGGSAQGGRQKVMMVIMVRANILPANGS
jgi:type II secretory pathway component GspD/PulD (secretin)